MDGLVATPPSASVDSPGLSSAASSGLREEYEHLISHAVVLPNPSLLLAGKPLSSSQPAALQPERALPSSLSLREELRLGAQNSTGTSSDYESDRVEDSSLRPEDIRLQSTIAASGSHGKNLVVFAELSKLQHVLNQFPRTKMPLFWHPVPLTPGLPATIHITPTYNKQKHPLVCRFFSLHSFCELWAMQRQNVPRRPSSKMNWRGNVRFPICLKDNSLQGRSYRITKQVNMQYTCGCHCAQLVVP